jgi:hypothetical protein
VRKDYPLADEVLYLPSDTALNARYWLNRHHFVAAFFIKYEFWFNYMKALKKRRIPLFYISLIFKPDSYFFKSYGRWFRKQLNAVTHFFVQDETTERLLRGSGFNNVTLCGDTRFDRVAAIAQQAKQFPEVERFIDGRQCIIAGSTWPPDEDLLSDFISKMPEDSMPSTQTPAPQVFATMTKVFISSLSFGSDSILRTKLLSILMVSKGSALTMPTEEKPVPKSSSATFTPLLLRLQTVFVSRLRSSSLHLSVTSRQRCAGG